MHLNFAFDLPYLDKESFNLLRPYFKLLSLSNLQASGIQPRPHQRTHTPP